MKRSHGPRAHSRYKLKKRVREKGMPTITRLIQDFDIKEKVHIKIEPAIQKGQPHHRFHGKTGTVVAKRGRAYLVEISDGNAVKQVICRPVHLKSQKVNA